MENDMRSSIPEVFEELSKAKYNGDRVFVLRKHDSMALRGLLRMNYDKSLNLTLPEGEPPYKKKNAPVGFGDATLLTSAKSWYVFCKESSPNLSQTKREFMFISLLESLDYKEAEILVLAKDRKLNLNLTTKVINEAFPDLIKDSVLEFAQDSLNTDEEVKDKPKKTKVASAKMEDSITSDEKKATKKSRGRPKKKSS